MLERLISLIAAHRCLICKVEGKLLCEACENSSLEPVLSRCYRCHAISRQASVCASCKSSVKINHVWVATIYDGPAKKLVHKLKFERAKAGAEVIAGVLVNTLPNLPEDVIISHIPTANNRVRTRGYDQAQLIAKKISRQKGHKHQALLIRRGKSRQVGATRQERFRHLGRALAVRRSTNISGKHILLIDDVTTTGATIEAAAKVLKQAGAKTIDVAVFAQA